MNARRRLVAEFDLGGTHMSGVLLWVVAAILVIVGIVQLLQGQVLLGIALIVVGCLVGPGGYSLFRSRHA